MNFPRRVESASMKYMFVGNFLHTICLPIPKFSFIFYKPHKNTHTHTQISLFYLILSKFECEKQRESKSGWMCEEEVIFKVIEIK